MNANKCLQFVLIKIKIKEKNKMKTTAKGKQETYASLEEYEKNCYFFSPSISKRKTVGGKNYYVRRYFSGAKDFEKIMENLAIKQTDKCVR